MRFLVFSRREATNAALVAANVQEPHIWISLYDPNSPPPVLHPHELRRSHLCLAFHDLDRVIPGYVLMDADHAKSIIDFVNKHRDGINLICVNCEAGISRSAATAMALSMWLNGHDSNIGNSDRYIPNIHVKSLLLTAAGVFPWSEMS